MGYAGLFLDSRLARSWVIKNVTRDVLGCYTSQNYNDSFNLAAAGALVR